MDGHPADVTDEPVTPDDTIAADGADRPAELSTGAVAEGDDIQVVGRTAVPVAATEEAREEQPALVGAAAGASTSAEPPRAAAMPWAAPPVPGGDLAPWSFGTPEPEPAGPPSTGQAELPLPPAAAAPPAPRPVPMFGPVGRRRSAPGVAILAAVTFGVSALVWHRRVNREMEEFDPKLHARPGRSTLAVAIPWAIGLLTSIAGAVVILADRFSVQLPVDPHVTVTEAYGLLGGLAVIPYLALLIPFSAIAIVMTLERLRCVEEHVGLTADRQVRAVGTSLLLLVPVVGGLVLLAVQQRRLNAVWEAVAPTRRVSR